MVNVSTLLAALLVISPALSLALPVSGNIYGRDFFDIENYPKARGFTLTRRDFDVYLEARLGSAGVNTNNMSGDGIGSYTSHESYSSDGSNSSESPKSSKSSPSKSSKSSPSKPSKSSKPLNKSDKEVHGSEGSKVVPIPIPKPKVTSEPVPQVKWHMNK